MSGSVPNTPPPITTGLKWTAAQWIAAWQAKADAGAVSVKGAGPGAVADGKSAILTVAVGVGSNVMTVGLPAVWTPSHSYAQGAVVTNGTRAYTCVIAGTSAASGGPSSGTGNGAPITDGSAGWLYIGQSSATANVFAASDVGKVLAVTRMDVSPGWNPWWSSASTYAGHVTITAFTSPTSITVSAVGSAAPPSLGTAFPNQSWPYAGVPSFICWGTDNSPAFQAALNLVQTAGSGAVYIPSGTYCFGSQMVIYSHTAIFGDGDSSVLLPCGVHDATPQSNIVSMFINSAGHSQTTTGRGPNSAASLRDQFGDTDITLSDFFIDMRATGSAQGSLTCRSYLLDHFRAQRVNILGNPLSAFEGINFTSCNDFQVTDSVLVNAGNGFDPWGGSTSGAFCRNRVIVPYNATPNVTFNAGQYNAVQVNVVGTSPSEDEVSYDFWIDDNDVFINGSSASYNSPIGLMMFPDGDSSIGVDIFFRRNRINCTGTNNRPILSSGGAKNVIIDGNVIVGADGVLEAPITINSQAGNTSATVPVSIQPTSGLPTMTVNWPAHGYSGANNSVVPVFLYTTTGLVVGGIALSGYYPVTAVAANTITINALSNAANSTLVTTSGGFWQIVVGAIDCAVTNNRLIDCASPSGALIAVTGIAHTVRGNDSFLSSGAATGNYIAIASFSGINNNRGGSAIANTGVPGTGVGVVAGNARVYWNQFEPAPLVLDTDDINRIVSPTDIAMNPGGGNIIPAYPVGNSQPTAMYTPSTGVLGQLVCQSETTSQSNPEWSGVFGIWSNKGEATGAQKVALYAGAVQSAGSGPVWSLNTVVTRGADQGTNNTPGGPGNIGSGTPAPGTISLGSVTIGYELDWSNFDQDLPIGSGFGVGMWINMLGSYRATAAIYLSNTNSLSLHNYGWYDGILFAGGHLISDNTINDGTNSIYSYQATGTRTGCTFYANDNAPYAFQANGNHTTADFFASDNAPAVLLVSGTHTHVLDLSSATISGTAWNGVFSATSINSTPIGSTAPASGAFTSLGVGVASVTGTSYSVAAADTSLVLNPSGAFTLTLPTASSNTGRVLTLKLIASQAVSSASSNVVPLAGGAAGTAIMTGTAGKFCVLQSDGTSWQIMQAN